MISLALGSEAIPDFLIRPGIAFQETGDLHLTNNHWVVAVTHSINSTITAIQSLSNQYEEMASTIHAMIPEDSNSIHLHLENILQLGNSIQSLLATPQRTSRAPLGFVGSLMNSLFGTAEDDDVQALLHKVGSMDTRMQRLTHFQDQQLSILNSTAIHQQRQDAQISSLTTALKALNKVLTEKATQEARLKEIEKLRHFQSRVQDECQDLAWHLSNFIEALDVALGGHISPFFLRPSEFRNILTEIATNLPQNFFLQLPLNPGSESLWYRSCLVHHVLTLHGTITIFLTVPLATRRTHFRIFRVYPLIFPTPTTSGLHFQKYTNLPTYFSVSHQDTKIFLEFDVIPSSCTIFQNSYFCPDSFQLRHASVTTCTYETFTNKTSGRCQPAAVVTNPQPQVFKAGTSKWFLNVPKPINIDWHCDDQDKYPELNEITNDMFISVPNTCHATMDGKLIYGDFTGFSSKELTFAITKPGNFTMEINNTIFTARVNLSEYLPEGTPRDNLYKIDQLHKIIKIDQAHAEFGKIVAITGYSITSAIIIVLLSTIISLIVSHIYLRRQLRHLQHITPIYEIPKAILRPPPPSSPAPTTIRGNIPKDRTRRAQSIATLADLQIYN